MTGLQESDPKGIQEVLPAQRVNPKPNKKPQSCCGFRIPYF